MDNKIPTNGIAQYNDNACPLNSLACESKDISIKLKNGNIEKFFRRFIRLLYELKVGDYSKSQFNFRIIHLAIMVIKQVEQLIFLTDKRRAFFTNLPKNAIITSNSLFWIIHAISQKNRFTSPQ